MSTVRQKIVLGENHRRVISVLLREVEKACDEVLDRLDRRPGLLNRLEHDLTAEQQSQLRELVDRLREEICRFKAEVTLNVAVQSERRDIAALLSAAQIDVEECKSPRLRGYGELPEEVERALNAKLNRLLLLLAAMIGVAERG